MTCPRPSTTDCQHTAAALPLSHPPTLPLSHPPAVLLLAPLAAAGLLLFTRLNCPLLEPEETRYAEIPRQMLAEGRFFTPVWQGQAYWHKPPLFYWLVMASYRVFGVHDWSARLVPCLASFLTVLTVCLWTRRTAGPWPAFWSALIVALSPRFLYQGRMVTLDSLLALWVIAGLAFAHLALRGRHLRWSWWLASGVACGLGMLTKGPVAAVLIVLPVVVCGVFGNLSSFQGLGKWLPFLFAAAVVAGPWYLMLALRHPEAAGQFFWLHNVQRFFDPFDHAQPWWYYLPILFGGMLPWSLLAVPLGWQLIVRRARQGCDAPRIDRLVVAALAGCVLFFSLAGCKRPGYILPAMPLLAMLLGSFLTQVLATRPATVPAAALAEALIWTSLCLGVAVAVTAALVGLWPASAAVLAGVLAAGFGVGWTLLRRRLTLKQRWGACATIVFLILMVGAWDLLPAYHRRFSLRGQVRRHADRSDLSVLCYPRRWDGIGFYLGRSDIRAHDDCARLIAELDSRAPALVFIKNRGYLDRFLEQLPSSLQFVPFARQGPNVTSGVVRLRDANGE